MVLDANVSSRDLWETYLPVAMTTGATTKMSTQAAS